MSLGTALAVGIILIGVGLLAFSVSAFFNRGSHSEDIPADEGEHPGDPLV